MPRSSLLLRVQQRILVAAAVDDPDARAVARIVEVEVRDEVAQLLLPLVLVADGRAEEVNAALHGAGLKVSLLAPEDDSLDASFLHALARAEEPAS